MQSPSFSIEVKPADKRLPDSFLELVRLKSGYLFDEIYIRSIQHHVFGVEIVFDYERHGHRLRDLSPCVVSLNDWAASRSEADVPGGNRASKQAAFAKTAVAERLFSDGSRQFNQKYKKAEEDFMADASFLGDIGPEPA